MAREITPILCAVARTIAGRLNVFTDRVVHVRRRYRTNTPMLAATILAVAIQPLRFRADTDIVAINVTVTDRDGRLVSGLTPDDFSIQENDRLRPIAQFAIQDVPISLVVALDLSGSMQGPRFERARQAVIRLSESLRPGDDMCLYGFNEVPHPLVDWTTERASIVQALDQIRPSGGTALYDAVTEAIQPLRDRRRRRQALVVISDGNDHGTASPVPATTTPDEDSLRRQGVARALTQRSEALLYAIGIDAPNTIGRDALIDAEALRALTDRTGGFTEIVKPTTDLVAVAERIANELHHQYLIGFTPTALDGKFHRVKVTLRRCDGCSVRARTGFFADPVSQ